MAEELWTSIKVADRIREAAETLRLLPNHHPGRRYRGAWPEILRNPNEAYGYEAIAPRPSPPKAAAIDRMDEVVMNWMGLVEPEDVRLMWSWALGVPAVAVGRRLRIHRSTVHRRRMAAFKRLAVNLNRAGMPVREADTAELATSALVK
jgi:hypothetical protein